MPFDQAHKQYETARHLPPPLYVLFVQATAYGQACGEYGGWAWRGYGGSSHSEEALPSQESSPALPKSPQVVDAASPLLLQNGCLNQLACSLTNVMNISEALNLYEPGCVALRYLGSLRRLSGAPPSRYRCTWQWISVSFVFWGWSAC